MGKHHVFFLKSRNLWVYKNETIEVYPKFDIDRKKKVKLEKKYVASSVLSGNKYMYLYGLAKLQKSKSLSREIKNNLLCIVLKYIYLYLILKT